MRKKDGDEDNEAMGNKGNGRLKPATETVQTDRHTKRHAESERERARHTAYAATKRFLERQRQSLPQHAVNFRVPCPIVILNTKWRRHCIERERDREKSRARKNKRTVQSADCL